MDKLTLITTYYNNPMMLRKQIETWSRYPLEVWDKLKVIIVDDGTPGLSAKDVFEAMNGMNRLQYINTDIYRIKEDIYNNVGGARNLGFSVVKEGWCLNIDLDHVIRPNDLVALLSKELNPYEYYRLMRYFKDKRVNSHSDTFLMTKKEFWKIGGYDEDMVKYYYKGACHFFRRAMGSVMKGNILADVNIHLYTEELIRDSNPLVNTEKPTNPDVRYTKPYKPQNQLRFNWEKVL